MRFMSAVGRRPRRVMRGVAPLTRAPGLKAPMATWPTCTAGLGTWEAQRQAYARFYGMVQGQAQALAYIDTFWLLAAGAALMFALAFTLQRNDPRATGAVSVH